MNQNFYSMIDRYKHQQLRIGPVSPQQIRAWANKILPNGEIVGEVTKPYTFDSYTASLSFIKGSTNLYVSTLNFNSIS